MKLAAFFRDEKDSILAIQIIGTMDHHVEYPIMVKAVSEESYYLYIPFYEPPDLEALLEHK